MTNIDDFMSGGDKIAAGFTKHSPVGTVVKGIVLDADVMQCRNFETNEPEWWDEARTQPKQQLVVTLQTELSDSDDDDGRRKLYAKKPGEMLTAIHSVSLGAGKPLRPGGELAVQFTGTRPHDNPRLNDIKLYRAQYNPPAQAAVDDLLGDQTPAAEPATVGAPAGQPAGQPADDLL